MSVLFHSDDVHALTGGLMKEPEKKMGRPVTLDGPGNPWYELAAAFGTVDAMVAAFGVEQKTIYRWVRGTMGKRRDATRPENVPLLTRQAVNAIARARGTKPPFRDV